MSRNALINLTTAIITLAIVLFGIFQSLRQQRSARRNGEGAAGDEEFHLGSRAFGRWPAGLSGAASAESGWVLLGLVGVAYSSGIGAFWLIPGCVAGYLFTFVVLGPRLRTAAAHHSTWSLPDLLARSASEWHAAVFWLSALIIVLLMTTYAAAQLNAVGKTLNALAGVPYAAGVLIGLGIVLTYLMVGGFRASVLTDMAQAVVMVGTLLLTPILGILTFSGDFFGSLTDHGALFDVLGGAKGMAAIGFLLGWLGIGLGYMGQPHVLARPMATRDDREVRRSGLVAASWATLVFAGAVASGLVIRAWLPSLPDPEHALPAFASTFLPVPLAGLVVAAILAAICSTADSQLMVANGVISGIFSKQRGLLSRPRFVLAMLGIAAAALALTENRMIFTFVLYAWAVLGASIGPAIIGVLLWPRTSGRGIVAGMLGGSLTVIAWKLSPTLTSISYELVPAFLVGLVLTRFVAPRVAQPLEHTAVSASAASVTPRS